MPDIAVTSNYGGLGSYEAFRDELIKRAERPEYFSDPPPSLGFVKGGRPTVGFGYDLQSRKEEHRPEKIVADFEGAGIPLTVRQQAAILFWGGWDKDRVAQYLADSGAAPFTEDDRNFIERLDDSDRTDASLKTNLDIPEISKAQADRLFESSVGQAEREVDRRLHSLPKEIQEKLERTDQRAVLVDLAYQQPAFIGHSTLGYLRQGDLAGAAFDIAFLDNRGALMGLDKRNFARAEAFLGGTFAPRTREEAQAFLDALEKRQQEIFQAEANRTGDPALAARYRARLDALRSASRKMLDKHAALELRPDGAFAVREAVSRDELAGLFGIAPNDVGLLVRSASGGEAGGGVLAPGDVVRLPGATEQLAILLAGGGFSAEPPAGLEAIVARREHFEDILAWLTGSLDVHRLSGRSPFLDPSWSPGERWFDDHARLRFDYPEPQLDVPPLVAPGRRSGARGARGTGGLSKESIELIDRKLDLMMELAIRLRDIIEKVARTPLKVTAKGPWGG